MSRSTSKIGSVKAKVLPFLRLAFDGERAEIDADELARDVQTEAEPVLLPLLVVRDLVEAVEDQLDVLRRDAGAAVGDADGHVAGLRIIARPYADVAVLAGVFGGVGAEIDDDAADALGVGEDGGKRVGNGERDRDLVCGGLLLERGPDLLDQARDRLFFPLHADQVGFQPARVEDAVDHLAQLIDAGQDDLAGTPSVPR